MTPEKALEMIKFALERFPTAFLALNGTWEKCVEALEKQIPRKPCNIKTAPNHAYSTYGDCPCCNEEAFEYQHCCIYCGQKLDWGDEE